jgi:hypothetical protein
VKVESSNETATSIHQDAKFIEKPKGIRWSDLKVEAIVDDIVDIVGRYRQ